MAHMLDTNPVTVFNMRVNLIRTFAIVYYLHVYHIKILMHWQEPSTIVYLLLKRTSNVITSYYYGRKLLYKYANMHTRFILDIFMFNNFDQPFAYSCLVFYVQNQRMFCLSKWSHSADDFSNQRHFDEASSTSNVYTETTHYQQCMLLMFLKV